MSEREQVSKRVRFEVFKRDGFTCQYCGAHPPGVMLHVDHINPVALGGKNGSDNLITACADCNLGKAAVPLTLVPKSLAERAADVAEREAQIAGYSQILEARLQRLEADTWRVAEALTPGASDGYNRNRFNGIQHFVTNLGVHKVLEAADIALAKYPWSEAKAFKYFCGICWNWIRGQQ